MKKIFLFLLTIYCTNLWAQDTTFKYGEGVTPEAIQAWKERLNFVETCNRLFSEKKYDSMLTYIAPYQNRSEYATKSKYFALSTYYFLGNEAKSKQLLEELFDIYQTTSGVVTMFQQSDNLAFKSYLEVKKNKEFVEHYIEEIYKKEKHPETENGLKIIRLYINDQWIKRNSALTKYKTADSLSEDKLNEVADNAVYNFYKKHKRLFNKSEVGESVSNYQKMLLWHNSNKVQRAFLQTLVKKAVQKGDFPVKLEVDFILKNELLEQGREVFWQNLDKRIEEVKKEYNLSEYTFFPY